MLGMVVPPLEAIAVRDAISLETGATAGCVISLGVESGAGQCGEKGNAAS